MVHSIYPVLMTNKIEKSSLFYKTYFGFAEVFASDWYISLSHPDGGELALISADHETIPAPNRFAAKGILINIEVENASQMYNTIQKQDENIIVVALRDEDYGQRHFMVQDPNGVLIDIIEQIPPSDEFQNHNTGEI